MTLICYQTNKKRIVLNQNHFRILFLNPIFQHCLSVTSLTHLFPQRVNKKYIKILFYFILLYCCLLLFLYCIVTWALRSSKRCLDFSPKCARIQFENSASQKTQRLPETVEQKGGGQWDTKAFVKKNPLGCATIFSNWLKNCKLLAKLLLTNPTQKVGEVERERLEK